MPIVRAIECKDVAALYELGSKETAFSFDPSAPGFWSRDQLLRWSKEGVCLGAFIDENLVGFALATLHAPTGKAVIENLFVIPEARRTGVGRMLNECMIAELRSKGSVYVCLYTDSNNIALCDYFCGLGYRECGTFSWLSRCP